MALRAVRRVTEEGAYSNLAVPAELGRSGLSHRDRQFATDLAYGTVRKLLCLDRVLASCSSRPLGSLDPDVLALLRLGAYQLIYTRAAPHAAVSETVGLAGERQRGFVNAVLRAVTRRPPGPPASGEGDGAVSARTGLAAWAVGELRRLLPDGEVEEAAAALATPAPLTLRTNRCRATPEELVAALRGAGLGPVPGRHHPDAVTGVAGPVGALPGYGEGWFAVQDEASMLVAEAVGARPGERILDACAGPGGKASHLACAVAPDGALVAGEVSPGRAGLVRGTAERLGVAAIVLAQDALAPAVRGGFDAALVDAPCSGLGSARRRPELLWRPARSDLARLARLQVALLESVADLVRPGGRLVYSVCTFPRAETDAAVRAFLAKRPDVVPADVPGPHGPAPTQRLWPHRDGADAMFYAGFSRTGG